MYIYILMQYSVNYVEGVAVINTIIKIQKRTAQL